MTVVEVLRHGKAFSRKRWSGPGDRERPLTDEGWHQAKVLVPDLMEDGPITAIVSSPLLRCTQTVDPLAGALGLPLVTDERLAELRTLPVTDDGSAWVASAWLGGRAVGLVDELVDDHPDATVVICTHGDVIPALLAVLAGRDGFELTDARVKKGARVALTFDGGRCVMATPVDQVPKYPAV